MRTLCASTLVGEFIVIALAGLALGQLSDVPTGTLWTVSGIAMALCLLVCGLITRPGGIQLGWVLQGGLIASGFALPAMFVLGAVFAGLWWASIHYGRRVDDIRAARERATA
ncbi:DUF4233 domain-containing protein [Streptomyces avicenniae]|uniref:DUF4233 domain-containing protein n=1 Tax=Streptomyces avicenniae TaxID=500153 RepID=UPI00069C0D62|nr:DUF4233 domain-containing protein [Streptomyces avicenniae]